jgi:hypothetical protein
MLVLMKNKCTTYIDELIIFEIMRNVCNYGCIVYMNKFWMYIFLVRMNLVVTGNTNMLVIGNEYTSDVQEDYACHS